MNTKQRPDIFGYSSYREYLTAMVAYLKESDPKYSYRFISRLVGAGSAGWLPNILKGRINLTSTYATRLMKILKLKSREQEYFELLIRYDQAGSVEEKSTCFEKMHSFKEIPATLVSREHLDFYSKWYISAIRELLFIYNFRGNYRELAKRLNPSISPAEAEKAIKTLVTLGFIKKDAQGSFRPMTTFVRKDGRYGAVHWANIMKDKIRLAGEAIDRFPRDQRDISEVFVPLSREGFEQVREEINQLRRRILALSEKDAGRTEVYQCNIQFFPLTKKN